MKKHDEGYALVLVLVVMIVISLVAATVLTFSLRNLQNQQKSIQRMEDKYAAQGMVEEYLNSTTFVSRAESNEAQDGISVELAQSGNVLTATITAKNGTATIKCKVNITGTNITLADNVYTVTSPKIVYGEDCFYEISYQEVS